ncbi:DUF1697 domain-containing protein [Roseateles sp. DXS20W]|uniref:DUF1697 domain-containing protein n=1 Tax=Pelomonas lactea TaxID=3299030 RepID=A0ABW7GN80_9BURK
MPRYVALLRGVSPMNCKMPELQRSLEDAGFTDVKTLLSSGNVAFSTPRAASAATLRKKLEAAMQAGLGRSFETHVRASQHLQQLIVADPFAAYPLRAGSKRVVTFLREPLAASPVELPRTHGEACIWGLDGAEVFCSYVPEAQGPVFMQLLEKTFGKDITTRTWDTVAKCASA